MIDISGENVVLVGALLLFVAVMAGKVAYRFGAPALLLFLGVGMLFGLNFISYRSVEMTQFVGMIALCIILFTGGMDTKFSEIKPIIGPGVVLATVGVVMTAFVLAGFVWLVAPCWGSKYRSRWHCCWPPRCPRPTRRRFSPSCEARNKGSSKTCARCWSWRAVRTTRWHT